MKLKNIINTAVCLVALGIFTTSCEGFLDRPAVDTYNVDNFYQTDEQCKEGVNYLYNSPWYDFQRGFISVGEKLSGNIYAGSDAYVHLSVTGTDTNLSSMSAALWAINAHANTVIENLLNAEGPSDEVRYQCIGEALVWKAFAYFFLVRSFGDVPVIHNNSDLLNGGEYNNVYKVQKACVYEYILMTLEKAMEFLPAKTSGWVNYERIEYYCAEALMSKVYLTMAGVSGSLDNDCLRKAADCAKDVIDNSGRTLMPNYEDIFRLSGFNSTGECLISWLWECSSGIWTTQNTLQSDLGMVGFDEFGDLWGDWTYPTVDLMEAFGVDITEVPSMRNETDVRRKATMMLAGDTYDYFWTDKGGFDYLRFLYDSDDYGRGSSGALQSSNGCNLVKHLYGDTYDHVQATGITPAYMSYQLPTHILRLADIYLVYAEAEFLLGNTSEALTYTNLVRERAGATALTSITYDDIWKERRLELAGEGDRWYDFVRRSYYDYDTVKNEIESQHRSVYYNVPDVYEAYYEAYKDNNFTYGPDIAGAWDASAVTYSANEDNLTVQESTFSLPFPTEDVVFNANLASSAEAIYVDVRTEYAYNY